MHKPSVILWTLLLTFCLFLGGCGQTAVPVPNAETCLMEFSGNFEADIEILYGDLQCAAHVSRSPESCTFVYTAPESLQDLTIIFTQDGVELQYKDLTFDASSSALPTTAVAKFIDSAVAAVMRKEDLELKQEDDSLLVDGEVEAMPFQMELDPATCHIRKLLLPDQELEIQFERFVFSD